MKSAVAADPLLDALVVLVKMHGVHVSPAALLDGALTRGPLQEDKAIPALASRGFRALWSEHVHQFLRPAFCPLLVKRSDGSYLVVTEVVDRQVKFVQGPQAQPVSLTLSEFLLMEPCKILVAAPPVVDTDRADVVGDALTTHWFWGSLWRFRRSFAEAVFLTVIVNVLALGITIFTMSVYDRVLPNQAYTTLWALAIGACVAIVFEFLARSWRATVLDRVGKKVDLLIGSLVFRHVMHMRLESQQGQSTGAVAHLIREYESVRDFVTSLTLTIIADLPFAFFFLLVIAYIAGAIAWVPAVAMALTIFVVLVAQFPLSRLMRESLRQNANRSGLVVEALTSLDSLKSLRAETLVSRQHDRIADQNAHIAMKTRLISNLIANFSAMVQQLATVAILVWGVYRVGENLATAGSLIAAVMLLGRALQPVSGLTLLGTRYQQARVSLQTLEKIMGRPLERAPQLSYFHRTQWEGSIRTARLGFKYAPQLPFALHGVNLTIRPGERVGIIGRMGSGKSTLLKLLSGLYQPSEGEVVMDSLDLRHVDVADIRHNLRTLSQDVRLMQGTLLENIRLAAPHATDDQLLEAARVTGVMEFASRHPLGLNAPVGEGGRMLSGGQRQAVALAQVMLSEAKVLLLDEPTASMDQVSERAIQQAIAQVAKGRTLLLVTHKASLLTLVDRLIVLEQGQLVLDGPRDEVIRRLAAPAAGESGAHGRPVAAPEMV